MKNFVSVLKEIFDLNRIELIGENEKIKKNKKAIEKELQEEKLKNEELKNKYIELLEEKANGFDKYIHYEEECIKLAEEKRQMKKEIAELKENLTNSK